MSSVIKSCLPIGEIQQEYFSNETKSQTLLDGYLSALKENDPGATMVRTSLGGTGFTFFCKNPSFTIEGEERVDSIGFVLKWQNRVFCEAERLGSEVFRFFDFCIPQMYQFDSEISDKIKVYAEKKKPSMETLDSKTHMLAMPQLYCNNLNDFIKKRMYFSLSKEEKDNLFYEFGRIASIDMLIGNNDRFLELSEKDAEGEVSKIGKFNDGNVLVDLTPSVPLLEHDRATSVRGVFPIDNCPCSRLLTLDKKEIKEFDLSCVFYAEEEEEDQGYYIADEQESNFSEIPAEAGKDFLAFFNSCFKTFVSKPEEYAFQFARHWNTDVCQGEEGESIESIKVQFARGLIDQLVKIKQEAKVLKKKISVEVPESGSLSKVRLLLEKNLEFLEEIELTEEEKAPAASASFVKCKAIKC